jgi:hypothetical protein
VVVVVVVVVVVMSTFSAAWAVASESTERFIGCVEEEVDDAKMKIN